MAGLSLDWDLCEDDRLSNAKTVISVAWIALVVACLAAPAAAQSGSAGETLNYRDCIDRIKVDPEETRRLAGEWAAAEKNLAARHCLALALVALEQFPAAGEELEGLAGEDGIDQELKKSFLAQAGNAWILAGEYGRARDNFSAALRLSPDDVDLLIDRARALAGAGRYGEAFDDLDLAVSLDPTRGESWILRAAARRHLGQLDRALEDVETVLALQPDQIDALFERAVIRRLLGDDDGARADWQSVVDLAPKSAAASDALKNLALIDKEAAGPD